MRSHFKVRNLRLRLEQLEDRLQPSLGLFGDPLAADPLTGQVEDSRTELQLVAEAAVSRDVTAVAQGVSTAPQQAAAQAPQTPAQTADQAITLQTVLNAGGGTIQSGKARGALNVQTDDVVVAQHGVVTPSTSSLVPIDPNSLTLTRTVCGEEGGPGTQDFVWSQYRGTADIEANFRVDATDAGVVYSAGVGTDTVAVDNPGTVTMRNGASCVTASIGTVDANFLILYGVNVAAAGGSVYTAGFDVFSGTAYIFKLSADLTAIEAAVQSPSAVALNFFFDIVNDAAGNRYVTGMTQNQNGTNAVRITKLDSNLTVPIVAPYFDTIITFTDGVGGPELNSLGLGLDVDAAGNAYVGGGIVRAADNIHNVTMRLNADGATLAWALTTNQGMSTQHGPNGGMYGVSVQGPDVYTTGIRADATTPTSDRLLIDKWELTTGSPNVRISWGITGGDLQGYGIDVSSDTMPLVAGTAAGPEGDIDGEIIKFGTGLNTAVGEDIVGNPTLDPNKDDDLYGMALIGSGVTADFVVSGDTNSDDLVPIMNACTGEDTFGGLLDGYMGRYAQPLP